MYNFTPVRLAPQFQSGPQTPVLKPAPRPYMAQAAPPAPSAPAPSPAPSAPAVPSAPAIPVSGPWYETIWVQPAVYGVPVIPVLLVGAVAAAVLLATRRS